MIESRMIGKYVGITFDYDGDVVEIYQAADKKEAMEIVEQLREDADRIEYLVEDIE